VRILPTPSEDEAAAIAVAIEALFEAERQDAAAPSHDDTLHLWVEASRRSAQRAGMQRGPWRLSGRIPRRARI
jgi:hypothetical protein